MTKDNLEVGEWQEICWAGPFRGTVLCLCGQILYSYPEFFHPTHDCKWFSWRINGFTNTVISYTYSTEESRTELLVTERLTEINGIAGLLKLPEIDIPVVLP